MKSPTDQFCEALMPDQWFAAGEPLHPFSVGHAILLRRMGSPFVATEGEAAQQVPGFGDLLVAVWICSRPATEALRRLDSWDQRLWLKVKRITRFHSLDRDRLAFLAYLTAAHQVPPLKLTSAPTGEESGAPWFGVLVAVLVKHYHHTVEEALNTPLAVARWLNTMQLVEEGVVRIETPEYQDFVAFAEAQRREFEAHPEKALAVIEQARKGGR